MDPPVISEVLSAMEMRHKVLYKFTLLYFSLLSGYVTKIAVTPLDPPYPKTPWYMQTSRMFYGTEVIVDRSFRLRDYGFRPFCFCDLDLDPNPMTFIYELCPGVNTGCANKNFLRQGFRKLSSDRQTDRQATLLYTTSLRRWSKIAIRTMKVWEN